MGYGKTLAKGLLCAIVAAASMISLMPQRAFARTIMPMPVTTLYQMKNSQTSFDVDTVYSSFGINAADYYSLMDMSFSVNYNETEPEYSNVSSIWNDLIQFEQSGVGSLSWSGHVYDVPAQHYYQTIGNTLSFGGMGWEQTLSGYNESKYYFAMGIRFGMAGGSKQFSAGTYYVYPTAQVYTFNSNVTGSQYDTGWYDVVRIGKISFAQFRLYGYDNVTGTYDQITVSTGGEFKLEKSYRYLLLVTTSPRTSVDIFSFIVIDPVSIYKVFEDEEVVNSIEQQTDDLIDTDGSDTVVDNLLGDGVSEFEEKLGFLGQLGQVTDTYMSAFQSERNSYVHFPGVNVQGIQLIEAQDVYLWQGGLGNLAEPVRRVCTFGFIVVWVNGMMKVLRNQILGESYDPEDKS